MRNQRVTSATLGLALLAASAPGWAADEQENPPAPDNPSYAAEVQSIPSVAKPIKGQAGATGLVEGQSLTLTTRNFYSRENMGYTDLMVDGAPLPHQPDTIIRWLIDRLRS